MPESDYVQGFMGRRGKFKRHIYYRRPNRGEHKGWIVVGGRGDVEDMSQRGFEPLWKYGNLREFVPGQEGKVREENLWTTILKHPDGPAEFPAEQIMVLRWYTPEECPVPGVKFPQLAGHTVKEYRCPECSRPPFAAIDGMGGVEPLGRHLRLIHSWDRASLVKYGEKVGIDFEAIYSSIEEVFEFKGEAQDEVSPAQAERSKVVLGEFDCECGWKPKANAKKPGFALMLHKRGCQVHSGAPIPV